MLTLVLAVKKPKFFKLLNYLAFLLKLAPSSLSLESRSFYFYHSENLLNFYTFLSLAQQFLFVSGAPNNLSLLNVRKGFLRVAKKKSYPAFLSLFTEESVVLPKKYGPRHFKKKILRAKVSIRAKTHVIPEARFSGDNWGGIFLAIDTQRNVLAYNFFRRNFLFDSKFSIGGGVCFSLFIFFYSYLSAFLAVRQLLPYLFFQNTTTLHK